MTDTASPPLVRQIRDAIAANPARILRIEHAGKTIWVKRKEQLTGLARLQKGDAARAFEAERAALHHLAARDVPVPKVVDEGPDHIAMLHSGETLDKILRRELYPASERRAIYTAAGHALADLHRKGLSHGRPSPKDIAWDGARITFLDFERFAPKRNTPRGHAVDVALFVFGGFSIAGGASPEVDAAIAGYRAREPGGIWDRAARMVRRLSWLDWLSRPLRRSDGGAREIRAIPLTLAAFRAE